MRSVLVVGGDSLLGRGLAGDFAQSGWNVIRTTRRAFGPNNHTLWLDLATANPETTSLPEVDVAIFAAAMTRFAECRAAPELARRVNLESPVALARRFAKQGTRAILLSTSAVFDGSRPNIHADTPTSPMSVYGTLKAEAEVGFLALDALGSVVRLTKVLDQTNVLMTAWVAALRRGEPVDAFEDLRLSPITPRDVTIAALAAASSGGIVQVSGAGDIAYADAALHFAHKLERSSRLVRRISAAERGIPEGDRPRYASLDTTTLSRRAEWQAPDPYSLLDAMFLPDALTI